MKAKHRTKRIQRYRKMLGIIVLMLTITLIGVVVSATVHLLLMWYFHIREIPKYMPTRLWFVLWRMAGYNMYPIELYPPRIILRKHGIRHG